MTGLRMDGPTDSRIRPRDPSPRARLAAGVAAILLAAAAPPNGSRSPGRDAPANAAPFPGADPVVSFLATALARPLFSPTRRPAVGAAGRMSRFPRLAGTVVDNNGVRIAIFAEEDPQRAVVLHQGGRLRGLVILGIDPGRVLARGSAGPVTIRVVPGSVAAAPVMPPPFVLTKDPRSRAADNQDE